MVVQNHPDAWLLKSQTSARKWDASGSTADMSPPKSVGSALPAAETRLHCWGFSLPYPRSFNDSFPKSGRKLLLQKAIW